MAVSKRSVRRPKFALGAPVRVRRGVADPDCPAMPLGGWTGVIADIDQSLPGHAMYLIEWSPETLRSVHRAYHVRCQRAALDETCMWLDESSLEENRGTAIPIEQPSPEAIRILFEQDERVKQALQSPSDAPLPPVTAENLVRYHSFLAARLSFPFEGEDVEADDDIDVTVVGLADLESYKPNSVDGLVCLCRQQNRPVEVPLRDIEVKHEPANRQLIEDYIYWLGGESDEGFQEFHGLQSDVHLHDHAGDRHEVALGHAHDHDHGHDHAHGHDCCEEHAAPAATAEPAAWDDVFAPAAEESWDLGVPLHRSGSKVGRNDPCPCGSGLKFKKCCLKR